MNFPDLLQLLRSLPETGRRVELLQQSVGHLQQAVGRIEARQLRGLQSDQLSDYEFKVHSQWGEDGIIQHLLRRVPVARTVFIEFGVQDYTEANTRFLLTNNNWSGLIFDGSADAIASIQRDPIYWRYNLKAAQAFITLRGSLRPGSSPGRFVVRLAQCARRVVSNSAKALHASTVVKIPTTWP